MESPHEGKRKAESLWLVHRIHYERNRYIFDLYYKVRVTLAHFIFNVFLTVSQKHQITKELYDWLVAEKIADAQLHAKWKKPGYEKLCSLLAISKAGHNYGAVSVCRIPLKERPVDRRAPSVETGCISCCSSDPGAPIWWDAPTSLWKDI